MMSPKELIMAYIDAIEAQDFKRARAYLADTDFDYIGPNMHYTNPDDFIAFLFGMGSIQKDIATRRVLVDGNEVCVLLDYKTFFEPIGDVRVALWARVNNERFQKIELFYNAAVVENMLAVDGKNPFLPNT